MYVNLLEELFWQIKWALGKRYKPWQYVNIININAPSFLNINFYLEKQNDLFLFQKILSETDLIETFNVKEFNNRFAYINIKYYGKINKIKEKLNKKGLDIKFTNNQWSARLK